MELVVPAVRVVRQPWVSLVKVATAGVAARAPVEWMRRPEYLHATVDMEALVALVAPVAWRHRELLVMAEMPVKEATVDQVGSVSRSATSRTPALAATPALAVPVETAAMRRRVEVVTVAWAAAAGSQDIPVSRLVAGTEAPVAMVPVAEMAGTAAAAESATATAGTAATPVAVSRAPMRVRPPLRLAAPAVTAVMPGPTRVSVVRRARAAALLAELV